MVSTARLVPLLALLGAAACGGSTVTPNDGGGGTTTSAGSSTTTATATGGGGTTAPHDTPDATLLPKPTGTCPDFKTGKVTFSPAGIPPRDVLIWASGTPAAQPGPLVYFWHGAGGDPSEASYALGSKAMSEIQAQGGIVVAPYHDLKSSTLPWYLCLGGTQENDLLVADEVLACAIEKRGVDLRRIHTVGFSAGAMHTEQFAARRSGYLASLVAYSGAQLGTPPIQDEKNLYPAMLLYGGPDDQVIVSFDSATHQYHQWLTDNGHFSFICNHGKGHTVPSDARDSAWQFLQDHPYGARPEPYQAALPAGFPSYCALDPAQ
jgi:pimeloyl-ACP methyl ester carboxylesterase